MASEIEPCIQVPVWSGDGGVCCDYGNITCLFDDSLSFSGNF